MVDGFRTRIRGRRTNHPFHQTFRPLQGDPVPATSQRGAERKNCFAIEGTRCVLMQSGLSENWWVLAVVMFAMMHDATLRGADGFTPWQRRFQEDPEFKI